MSLVKTHPPTWYELFKQNMALKKKVRHYSKAYTRACARTQALLGEIKESDDDKLHLKQCIEDLEETLAPQVKIVEKVVHDTTNLTVVLFNIFSLGGLNCMFVNYAVNSDVKDLVALEGGVILLNALYAWCAWYIMQL